MNELNMKTEELYCDFGLLVTPIALPLLAVAMGISQTDQLDSPITTPDLHNFGDGVSVAGLKPHSLSLSDTVGLLHNVNSNSKQS